ncbi:MAG: class E sortase [Rubrobacteraceae bacterium]|nr:class E sortase [Rubrobacteraceae bacterium]MCL6437260.1 class E sortase [Rubrobacteraceae bacterium]
MRLSVIVVALGLAAFAVLPIFPRTETVSTKIHPQAQPQRLLGEWAGTRPAGGGSGPTVMKISIPRLGLKDVPVPDGSTQSELDKIGIMHLSGTGYPWQKGSNTFIVGHRLGYLWTRTPYVFYKLNEMKPGDRIVIERGGKTYTFRVYDRVIVRPDDYWVTYPVPGRTIVSLQTCTPIPTFQYRLIVRGELVSP